MTWSKTFSFVGQWTPISPGVNARTVCANDRSRFEDRRYPALLLPTSLRLKEAILQEESDRAHRSAQSPAQTIRLHPLAQEFDSPLPVGSLLY